MSTRASTAAGSEVIGVVGEGLEVIGSFADVTNVDVEGVGAEVIGATSSGVVSVCEDWVSP